MLFLNVDEAHVPKDLRQSRGKIKLPAISSRERSVIYEVI
jgi:hypothetical protein